MGHVTDLPPYRVIKTIAAKLLAKVRNMSDAARELSIIIPFYDEVAFLPMALSSVLAQPIDSLDVVIVNDNPFMFSPDYFEPLLQDDRVRLVNHPQNEGLSVARNTGMAHARGQWIGFLDSDDYYLTDGLAKQLDYAKTTGADITHALHLKRGIADTSLRQNARENALFKEARCGAGLMELPEAQFINSSWCSLYSADFVARNSLGFQPELRKYEDRSFVLQSVTLAESIAFSGITARVYRKRGQSITTQPQDLQSDLYKLKQFVKCTEIMSAYTAGMSDRIVFESREAVITMLRLLSHKGLIRRIERACSEGNAEVEKLVSDFTPRASLTRILDNDDVLRRSAIFKRTKAMCDPKKDLDVIREAMVAREYHRAADVIESATAARLSAPNLVLLQKTDTTLEKDVVLHIGVHKTGTTFLQKSFVARREALEGMGFYIPHSGLPKSGVRNIRTEGFQGHGGLLRPLRVRVPKSENHWNHLLSECATSEAQNVLISSENLLAPFHHNRINILRKMANKLRRFRSVRVVAFLRRPDRWIEALYGERLVQGEAEGVMSAGEFAVDFGPNLLDFPSLFGPLEDALGQEVEFLNYDAACQGAGPWDVFWNHLGRPDIAENVPPYEQRVYRSPSTELLFAAHMICRMFHERQKRRDVLRALFALQSRETNDAKMCLLSKFERGKLIDCFEEHQRFTTSRGYSRSASEMRKEIAQEAQVNLNTIRRELLGDLLNLIAQAEALSEEPSL